jgi:hypothetical protein
MFYRDRFPFGAVRLKTHDLWSRNARLFLSVLTIPYKLQPMRAHRPQGKLTLSATPYPGCEVGGTSVAGIVRQLKFGSWDACINVPGRGTGPGQMKVDTFGKKKIHTFIE